MLRTTTLADVRVVIRNGDSLFMKGCDAWGLSFSLRSNDDPLKKILLSDTAIPGQARGSADFFMIFRSKLLQSFKKIQLTLISGPAVSDRVEDRIRTGDLQSHNLAL